MRKEVKFYCEECKKEVTVEISVAKSNDEAIRWHNEMKHK